MTPKELLYIEDALGHTKFLMTQCSLAANQLASALATKAYQKGSADNICVVCIDLRGIMNK